MARPKTLKDYPNYLIYPDGRVFSLRRRHYIYQTVCSRGYHRVVMTINKKQVARLVHRLVCQAFLLRFDSGKQVNHIDGDKSNNRIDNLEMVTNMQNRQHAKRMGLIAKGESHGGSKIKSKHVAQIRALKGSTTYKKIGTRFGISAPSVSRIINKQAWRHMNG